MRVPSRPRDPVAALDGGIFVTVTWTEPRRTTDLTGYIIKYGVKDTDVAKYDELYVIGNTTNFQFTQFTHQLDNNTSYRFAVAAVNAAGRGEFSEFSDYVETKWGKYCCNHVGSVQLMLQCSCIVNESTYGVS